MPSFNNPTRPIFVTGLDASRCDSIVADYCFGEGCVRK